MRLPLSFGELWDQFNLDLMRVSFMYHKAEHHNRTQFFSGYLKKLWVKEWLVYDSGWQATPNSCVLLQTEKKERKTL